jgi:hypothetical protein
MVRSDAGDVPAPRSKKTVTAEPHMFEKFKSIALHGLIGLTAFAIVPLSCILVLVLTDEEQIVHNCPTNVCQGPLVSEYRNAANSAAKPQLPSYPPARQ